MSGENTTVTAMVTDTTVTKDTTAKKPGEEKNDKKKKSPAVLIGVVFGIVALVVIGVIVFRGLFAYRSVKVETCNGETRLEREGAEKDVFEGLKLVADDRVSTGADGEMLLLIDSDKHLAAAENTCFSINAAGNKNSGKVTIDLEYGSTLITIDEKLNEDSEFEVETPNCTCSVRGTTFNVAYDSAFRRTRVDVMDGVVRVKAGENEIDVHAGEYVIVEDETIYYESSGDQDQIASTDDEIISENPETEEGTDDEETEIRVENETSDTQEDQEDQEDSGTQEAPETQEGAETQEEDAIREQSDREESVGPKHFDIDIKYGGVQTPEGPLGAVDFGSFALDLDGNPNIVEAPSGWTIHTYDPSNTNKTYQFNILIPVGDENTNQAFGFTLICPDNAEYDFKTASFTDWDNFRYNNGCVTGTLQALSGQVIDGSSIWISFDVTFN